MVTSAYSSHHPRAKMLRSYVTNSITSLSTLQAQVSYYIVSSEQIKLLTEVISYISPPFHTWINVSLANGTPSSKTSCKKQLT